MLESVKDSLPKQWKTSPAVALPFDQLQLIDLAVGIHDSQSSKNGLFVALSNQLFPVFQPMAFTFAHDLPKGLNESMQCQ